MKVLITPNFNDAMVKLNRSEKTEAAAFFSMVSEMSEDDLVDSPLLTRLDSPAASIYTFRGRQVRVFCTFDDDQNLIFLDVKSAPGRPFDEPKDKEGQQTLFGANGAPKVYLDWDDEKTIYSFNGEPLAYLDSDDNVYGFNGRHLGWFEGGKIWDHSARQVGFTAEACPTFTQFEPFKSFKQFKPFKAFKEFAPIKPVFGTAVSNTDLHDFLSAGAR